MAVACKSCIPYFQVRDTKRGQRLAFTADLPAELGDQFQFNVERLRADPESWRGTFALYANQTHRFEWSQGGDQWWGRIHGLRAQEATAWVLPWLDELPDPSVAGGARSKGRGAGNHGSDRTHHGELCHNRAVARGSVPVGS